MLWTIGVTGTFGSPVPSAKKKVSFLILMFRLCPAGEFISQEKFLVIQTFIGCIYPTQPCILGNSHGL